MTRLPAARREAAPQGRLTSGQQPGGTSRQPGVMRTQHVIHLNRGWDETPRITYSHEP